MTESIKESDLKSWVTMYEPSLGERTFKVETIDNESSLSTVIDEIFKLLVNAYRGNFLTARNSRELLKKTDLAKIVIDSNGSIIACSLYREDLG